MFSFMQENDDPGPYCSAINHSLEIFAQKDPVQMARRGGGMYQPENSRILLPSLGQLLQISYPDGEVTFKGTPKQPLWQWSLIATNYLGRAEGTPLSGELISYRELDGGYAFYPAFLNQTLTRLSRMAEEKDPANLNNACLQLGGELHGRGDAGAKLNFFPHFPVHVIFWKGDDEVAASANLLFDRTANLYLHTEDVAVVGSLVVYFLGQLCG